jgi:hypothetical protein
LSLSFESLREKMPEAREGLESLPSNQRPNSWIRDQTVPCIQFNRCFDLGVHCFLDEITRPSLATLSLGLPDKYRDSFPASPDNHRDALPVGKPASGLGFPAQTRFALR